MRRHHDPFLKLLYRAGARDAVALFFPELAARIDWDPIEWIDKEVPIRGVRTRSVTADLVGRTRDVEGRYLTVLIHPELQMEPDADMDWRVLQYNMLQTELGRMRHRERVETLQHALLRFIRSRFPEAPEGLAERVGRVRSEPALDRLIERAAVANSLEEVERLLDA